MTDYTPPEYDTWDYSECADPLKRVVEQHLAGEPEVWDGPNRLHHSISATSPPPAWYFSPEGIEYMEERDYDFWDRIIQVAFQLGYHNGAVREGARYDQTARLAELLARAEERDSR